MARDGIEPPTRGKKHKIKGW